MGKAKESGDEESSKKWRKRSTKLLLVHRGILYCSKHKICHKYKHDKQNSCNEPFFGWALI